MRDVLLEAISSGDLETIQNFVLHNKGDVNFCPVEGKTLLMLAVENKKEDIALFLFKSGGKAIGDWNLRHFVIKNEFVEFYKYLARVKNSVKAGDIVSAFLSDNVQIINFLLDEKIITIESFVGIDRYDTNGRDYLFFKRNSGSDLAPLKAAIIHGCIKIIMELIERGIGVEEARASFSSFSGSRGVYCRSDSGLFNGLATNFMDVALFVADGEKAKRQDVINFINFIFERGLGAAEISHVITLAKYRRWQQIENKTAPEEEMLKSGIKKSELMSILINNIGVHKCLYLAIEHRNKEVIEHCIENENVNINDKLNDNDDTLLHLLLNPKYNEPFLLKDDREKLIYKINTLEILKYLANKDADVVALNKQGENSLQYALKSDKFIKEDAVRILLSRINTIIGPITNVSESGGLESDIVRIKRSLQRMLSAVKSFRLKSLLSDVDDPDDRDYLFQMAIENDCEEVVGFFVGDGVGVNNSINVNNPINGRSPLLLALESCSIKTIKFLIERGADIEEAKNFGKNFVHIALTALKVGNNGATTPEDIIKFLDFIYERNIQKPELSNLLLLSSVGESAKEVLWPYFIEKIGLEKSAIFAIMHLGNINTGRPDFGCCIIRYCCQKSNFNVASKIREDDIALSCSGDGNYWDGDTLLHLAIKQFSNTYYYTKEIATCLLNRCPDVVNVQNSLGKTPLHCALECNNIPVLKILLDSSLYHVRRQNFNLVDNFKNNVLHEAILNNSSIEIIEKLLQSIIRAGKTEVIHAKNLHEQTPLELAVLASRNDNEYQQNVIELLRRFESENPLPNPQLHSASAGRASPERGDREE